MENSCSICSLHDGNPSSHLSSIFSLQKRDQKAAGRHKRQLRGRRSCRGVRLFCFYFTFLQSKEAAPMYKNMNHYSHRLQTDGTDGSADSIFQCAIPDLYLKRFRSQSSAKRSTILLKCTFFIGIAKLKQATFLLKLMPFLNKKRQHYQISAK